MNDDEGEEWMDALRSIGSGSSLLASGNENWIQDMTDENWEQLGHDISNNTHLTTLDFYNGVLNDQKISYLFRGLKKSSSIEEVYLSGNGLSVAGVRCMVPFLQNASNLMLLNLYDNDVQSEGFNVLFRALRDSPIEELFCSSCDIQSIEIDTEHAPRILQRLALRGNSINVDGCREIAKLLQGGDATLESLVLGGNEVDDDCVEILVDALQSNTSLTNFNISVKGGYVFRNDGISRQGQKMLLKLVNNVSSIEATLQSNHTLEYITFTSSDADEHFLWHIDKATEINRLPEAGRKKVIEMQLNSMKRSELQQIQGVNHSVYNEVGPLHLPEVLALVGRRHGQGELYVALKSSIAEVISTVNRKECLKQRIAERRAIIVECQSEIEAAEAEIAAIEAAEVHVLDTVSKSRSNKRRRF